MKDLSLDVCSCGHERYSHHQGEWEHCTLCVCNDFYENPYMTKVRAEKRKKKK